MGVITLLYKKSGEKKCLKTYIPISLLNVDYKIIVIVMANVLKIVLPNFIMSNAQTCCIKGKDIANTVVSVRDIIDLVEMDNLEGYIVKIEQEKAFGRVIHDYLFDVLDTFGFGPYFKRWMKIFYHDVLIVSNVIVFNKLLSS